MPVQENMFAFPAMLITAAEGAGMAVPSNPDDFKAADFPHFEVFCNAQLGIPMPYPGVHLENARVIAKIPADHIMKVTTMELVELGFQGFELGVG